MTGRVGHDAAGAVAAVLALLAALPGCHSMDGPIVLTLAPQDYPAAFDACLDQARDVGMSAVLADRSIGIIETRPRHVGSLVEPWRLDNDGIGQMAEATVQYQRRRVRFEFVPVGFTLPTPTGEGTLTGPLLPGSIQDEKRFDLEHPAGDVELRAWVFIERGFTPGLQPGNWSLSLTTTWTDMTRGDQARDPRDITTRSPTTWTPVERDEAMERTLLRRVQAQLASRGEAPSSAAVAGASPGAPPAAPAAAPSAAPSTTSPAAPSAAPSATSPAAPSTAPPAGHAEPPPASTPASP